MGLTSKQQMFASEYLLDLNATAAAKRAGYSARSAEKIGYELLEKTGVRAEVERLMRARQVRLEISSDGVIQEIAAIAFGSVSDVLDLNAKSIELKSAQEISALAFKSIKSIQKNKHGVSIHMHDKISALRLLADHLNLFVKENSNEKNLEAENRKDVLDRVSGLLKKMSSRA